MRGGAKRRGAGRMVFEVWHRYRATVVAGVMVACVLVASFLLVGMHMRGVSASELVVRVHDAGGRTYEYPLGLDGSYTVASSLGTNTICVEGGSVRMAYADCPNGSCMQQAALVQPGPQIVCLPHRLWVEVVGSDDAGAQQLNEDLVLWQDGSEPHFDTVAR